jgi:rubrerythrin
VAYVDISLQKTLINLKRGRHDNIRSKYGVRLMFTIRDIIDLAIQIEQNGEKVYRQAAGEISNSSISSLLLWLAGEEVKHVKWFSELKEKVNEMVDDPRIEETGKRILQGILGDQSFSLRDVDFSTMKETADLLKAAIEFQEDTVLFYEMIQSFIDEKETLNHLDIIIQEEKNHIRLLRESLEGGPLEPK